MVRKLAIYAACLTSIILVSSCGVKDHSLSQNGGNDQSGGSSTISITSPNNGISFRTKEKASFTIAGICERGVDIALATVPSRPIVNNCATDGTWSFESGTLSSGDNTFSIAANDIAHVSITATADLAQSMAIRANKTTINTAVDNAANLHVAFFDEDGAEIVIPGNTSPHSISWTVDGDATVAAASDSPSSGEKEVVSVNSGTSVTVHAHLKTIIDAYDYPSDQRDAEITIPVTSEAIGPIPGVAATMTLTADKTSIDVGKTANLQVHFFDINGAEIVIPEATSDHLITWTMWNDDHDGTLADGSIATVAPATTPSSREKAVVTGVGGGDTYIQADLSFANTSYGYGGNTTAYIKINVLGDTLSNIATVSSSVYTVTNNDRVCPGDAQIGISYTCGGITNVPSGTSKATLEANLTPDDPNESWEDNKCLVVKVGYEGCIDDPVQTGDTLVVTSQDLSTVVAYTVTVTPLPCDSPDPLAHGFQGGDGSSGNPYIISTVCQLNLIGSDLTLCTKNFKLGNDIDLTDKTFNMIGVFTGVFDGDNKKISNLTIDQPGQNYIGFISQLMDNGVVKNLGLENVNITGYDYVGGVVGWARGGSIMNSYVNGSVTGYIYVGGLAGSFANFWYVSYTAITNSYNSGSVTGRGEVGGLVGELTYASMTSSYNSGSVTAAGYVGGLVGTADCEGSITNSYNSGSVTGSNEWSGVYNWAVGGLVGSSSCSASITNSYNRGSVTESMSGSGDVGGLIGSPQYITITNSYWDIVTSGQTFDDGGTGESDEAMVQQTTFVDWDFTDIWGINDGVSYPFLIMSPTSCGDCHNICAAQFDLNADCPDYVNCYGTCVQAIPPPTGGGTAARCESMRCTIIKK